MNMQTNRMRRTACLTIAFLLCLTTAVLPGCSGQGEGAASSDVSSSADNSSPSQDVTLGGDVDILATTTEPVDQTTAGDTEPTVTQGPSGTDDPYASIPASLKGTTVRMLLWYQPPENEKKAIRDFTAKTDIKVETKIAVGTGPYREMIATSLAADEGYDVAMMNPTDFPSMVREALQPMNDIATFNADDPAWDKQIMNAYAVGGKYYGVNIRGNWQNDRVAMVYNKTMFEDRGVKTPRDYWKENNWNWDTFLEAAKAMTFTENGQTVYGYAQYTPNSIYYWPLSAGLDFVSFDGSQFTSNLSNPTLIKSLQFVADLSQKHKVQDAAYPYGIDAFRSGSAAMTSVITYVYKKDSTNFSGMTDEIDAVPFPSPKGSKACVPAVSKLFGILTKAKNPEAALYWLRYFLDPCNYDMDAVFINKNLKDSFTAMNTMEHAYMYSEGVIAYGGLTDYGNMNNLIALTNSAQIAAKLKSYESIYSASISKANRAVS